MKLKLNRNYFYVTTKLYGQFKISLELTVDVWNPIETDVTDEGLVSVREDIDDWDSNVYTKGFICA